MGRSEILNCEYTLFFGGDRHFMEAVSIPLAQTIESDLENDNRFKHTNDLPKYLNIDSTPKNDGGIIIGGIVGVFMFFATWAASKILDEVYEAKFRPGLKKVLKQADKMFKNGKHPKMLQLGISYAEKNVFILIGIVGDNFSEILKDEDRIKTVHKNAIDWIDSNSTSKPIHLYIINQNHVNCEPLLFDNLNMALGYIKNNEFEI